MLQLSNDELLNAFFFFAELEYLDKKEHYYKIWRGKQNPEASSNICSTKIVKRYFFNIFFLNHEYSD